MTLHSAVYVGTVVHKRLRPREHALSYRVFALLLDLDEIPALAARLRLFSSNSWNVLSFHDADHGPGDGTPIDQHIRGVLARGGYDIDGGRVSILCYPRVFGYVFNPLSVFYAFDRQGALMAIVYEVNNTFRERTSYVIGIDDPEAGVHAQSCSKDMDVSPFASRGGNYSFRITRPDEELLLAVQLRDDAGPLIKTLFRGRREKLDDANLLGLSLRFPLLTLKVIGAIHLEAAKLWLKGIPLVQRHRSPRYSVTNVLSKR